MSIVASVCRKRVYVTSKKYDSRGYDCYVKQQFYSAS